MELGKGFSFVGRQYRISSETEHYYIDLVFIIISQNVLFYLI
jgi:predicted nuclease of restriction endonuclease-like (RecB) superfamily